MGSTQRQKVSKRILARAIWVVRRLTPAGKRIVVNGFPSDEGSAVEMVRELLERGYGVDWLEAPSEARRFDLGIPSSGVALRCFPKRSVRGFIAFLRARAIMVTHGLYGNPPPMRGRVVLNIWHGDGPKSFSQITRQGVLVPADYIVGCTTYWARSWSEQISATPADRALVTGYPRSAQLFTPTPPGILRKLSIDPTRPLVVWLPTYRRAVSAGLDDGWDDAAGGGFDVESTLTIDSLIESLLRRGIQVAIKQHPLDAMAVSHPKAIRVSDDDIAAAGTTLYALLGASAGLITDYSSVFTDYLMLDRPIAFFMPDLPQYQAGRGLDPLDFAERVPGVRLDTDGSVATFAEDVLTGGAVSQAKRRAATHDFGVVYNRNPASAIIDLISAQLPPPRSPSTQVAP